MELIIEITLDAEESKVLSKEKIKNNVIRSCNENGLEGAIIIVKSEVLG